jgi:transcriptional regulator with XRE-family HTH domain
LSTRAACWWLLSTDHGGGNVPKLAGKLERAAGKVIPRTWTPNQVVAHNLTRARELRGWTQEEAADALAPYLGTRLSGASLSAIERSIRGTRVKVFSADELVALSRAFDLPLGWWFTPPDEGALHTPDHPRTGTDFVELVDITLGTAETLPVWTNALQAWAATHGAISAARPTGAPTTNLELRALALVRERFGDVGQARETLRRLSDVLDALDRPARDDVVHDESATTGTRRTRVKRANEPHTRAKTVASRAPAKRRR